MNKIILLVLVCLLTLGCLPRNAFAPPPYNYERWVKPGADKITIWKDMLDCNYAEPLLGGRRIEGGDRTFEQVAGSMICMERLGYAYRTGSSTKEVCRQSGWKATEACISGKDIPTPDSQRRLSGGYCKKYPESRACIP